MRLAYVVSMCVVAVGCGGGGISISGNESNFCEEIAKVACNNFYQCCTESEIQRLLGVTEPRTEKECREDVRRICVRNASSLSNSLEAGRVAFSAQAFNDCLNAVLAPEGTCASIESVVPWEAACMTSAFAGTVQTTGSCFFSHDCAGAPDSFCGPDQKCSQKPTAGFPCGSGCASDFYCGTNGLCQAKAAAGAPCMSNTQCQQGLFCDVDATPEPACAPKIEGGLACRSNSACLSNDCIPGRCMGTSFGCFRDTDCNSRCANSGATCTTSAQCALGNCSVGGNSCSSDIHCTVDATDVCIFPVQCVPGACIGDPVCTAQRVNIDYCQLTVNALPLF
jgi:hypothetical protein